MKKMMRRTVLAMLCSGWLGLAGSAHAQSPLEADIWARLSPKPHALLLVTIYVHTGYHVRCTAGLSAAKNGPIQRQAEPHSYLTADDGFARFRLSIPLAAPAGTRWVTANCTAAGGAQHVQRSVTVQSTFSLPYNARANATPPPPPLFARVDPAFVTFKNAATLTVRTVPGALCTGALQEESGNGIARQAVGPFRVPASGTARVSMLPTDFGAATVTVTCDVHKSFATAQASFTVQ